MPSWCTADMRLAIYPGDKAADRQREIEACVRRVSQTTPTPSLASNPPEIVSTGSLREGYLLEPGQVLARTNQRNFGEPVRSFVTPGGLDGGYFVLWDGKPCLTYGPYSENIHGFDERVGISSVQKITGAIALFIAEWRGLERAVHDDR